jgi:TMEM175 potassium channel family protein
MNTTRLEAFSDGVLAIIITIMVLELRPPHEPTWSALGPLWPVILSYVMSFVYLGIYWNNHHHMLHLTQRVTGGILWANLHLLFWLSLTPFTTAWMGETHFAPVPTAVYGVVLLACALSYYGLQVTIVRSQGPGSILAAAVGQDKKGRLSPVLYLIAVFAAFAHPGIAGALYATVALIWLIPDKRIERVLAAGNAEGHPIESKV